MSAWGFVEEARLLSNALFLLEPLLAWALLVVADLADPLAVSAAASLVAATTGLFFDCGSVPGTKRGGGRCGTWVGDAQDEEDKEGVRDAGAFRRVSPLSLRDRPRSRPPAAAGKEEDERVEVGPIL